MTEGEARSDKSAYESALAAVEMLSASYFGGDLVTTLEWMTALGEAVLREDTIASLVGEVPTPHGGLSRWVDLHSPRPAPLFVKPDARPVQKAAFYLGELCYAARVLMARGLKMPGLVLLFVTMDVAGWFGTDAESASKESFIRWTDKYMLETGDLACSSDDLYAARCGLLHTYSSESQLRRQGRARMVHYAWGAERVKDLASVIETSAYRDTVVAVHVEELYWTLRKGLERFLSDLRADGSMVHQRLVDKTGSMFVEAPAELIRAMANTNQRPS